MGDNKMKSLRLLIFNVLLIISIYPIHAQELPPFIPTPLETKPLEKTTTTNETVSEEKPVEETQHAEGTSFLSSLTFRIILITALFLIAGLVLFLFTKKEVPFLKSQLLL